jgi:hypothetical protein
MTNKTVISSLTLFGCCLALVAWITDAFAAGQSHEETLGPAEQAGHAPKPTDHYQ